MHSNRVIIFPCIAETCTVHVLHAREWNGKNRDEGERITWNGGSLVAVLMVAGGDGGVAAIADDGCCWLLLPLLPCCLLLSLPLSCVYSVLRRLFSGGGGAVGGDWEERWRWWWRSNGGSSSFFVAEWFPLSVSFFTSSPVSHGADAVMDDGEEDGSWRWLCWQQPVVLPPFSSAFLLSPNFFFKSSPLVFIPLFLLSVLFPLLSLLFRVLSPFKNSPPLEYVVCFSPSPKFCPLWFPFPSSTSVSLVPCIIIMMISSMEDDWLK